jgi:sporulation protein YlmC with PRC-barrel domain
MKQIAEKNLSPSPAAPLEKKPVTRIMAKSFIGCSIENTDGVKIGTIKDVMINLQQSKIDYVIIHYGSILGLGGKLFAIPFYEFRQNATRNVFVLNRTVQYLNYFPGFDKSHWPFTNAHKFYDDMDNYYGIPLLRL